ncbi:hypothetical protein QJ857_gp0767 [Tupanvirus soda lake]|uniref:Apple domain-containing protein n=2 Tax=Tupanvirus TaxID=2094720 RepID=A0A6N1P2N1_9VIRU|nr:hypothetical protein QJ857_gp0767 [Tupanvirus soda lake]QKU35281.1 hypothetical protein [Tupanvirus soda lake]
MGGELSTLTKCADENGVCSWPQGTPGQNVIYTANNQGRFRDIRGVSSVACDNNVFGDPAYGHQKHCYRRDIPHYVVGQNGIPQGFVKCSDEGGLCQTNYPADILYGADGNYVSGIVLPNQSVTCDNDVFGDPAYGHQKHCYIRPIQNSNQPINPPPQPINPPSQPVNPPSQPVYPPWWNPTQPPSQPPSQSPIQPQNPNLAPNSTALQVRDSAGNIGLFYGLPNVDVPGFDMAGMPTHAQNEQQCATKCLDNNKCNAYAFNTQNNQCWLKTFPQKQGTNAKFFARAY